jgi:glucose-6-phosphate dehydrogenase assembly protein OpcA
VAEAVDGLQDIALTWSGRALDVARIEAELGKLRYLAAGEPAGEGFALRTSLLNMVVHAENEDHAAHASRVIEDLSSHHPSRAIVVIGKPSDDESHIEAELAAHCHLSREAEQTVCCEEVTLHVSGRAARHLHSLVAPLLIPDLPVFVWWAEPLPEDAHEFRELLDLSDRLIVDSATSVDQFAGLMTLRGLMEEGPVATIGDLNWGRLSLWRQILQQQRQVQEVRHHLDAVDSVEIRYAGWKSESPRAAQAYLFLGWLAEELGWDLSRAENSRPDELVVLGRNGNRITVHTLPVEYPAVDSGSLVSVKITCLTDGKPAIVSVTRTGDALHLNIHTVHAGRASEGRVRCEADDLADILTMALDAASDDQGYRLGLENAVILGAAARMSS